MILALGTPAAIALGVIGYLVFALLVALAAGWRIRRGRRGPGWD